MPVPSYLVDTMKSSIGIRQTELALTSGRLFTATEAHRLGLVDELVDTKEEGLSKAGAFLKRFSNIPKDSRASVKLNIRQDIIDKMLCRYENELIVTVDHIMKEETQSFISSYLAELKNKSCV